MHSHSTGHHVPFALCALALAATQALAQQAAPAASQEVVVTATRVATPAQRTPVALAVYGGEALAEAGIGSVQALQAVDASINLTNANGAAYVAMRGVASTDVTETGDPSVAIARDGFFTNRSFSIGAGFYDLQRIEVLKGPQGTLFGRNSTGGLINIISQRPTKKLEGYVNLGLGNYSNRNLEAAVNAPLSSWAQLRVSAMSRKRDGYREVTLPERTLRGDDDDTQSLRVQLAAQPVAGLNALLSYQADRIDNVGDLTKVYTLATVLPIGDAKKFPGTANTLNKVDGDRLRWELSYDQLPGQWTLTYQGGIDKQTWQHDLDATADPTNAGYPAVRQFKQNEKPETTNHELRLATSQTGAFTGQFGVFHFTEKNTVDSGVFNVAMRNAPPGANDYGNTYGIKFDYKLNTKSTGLFGQAGWQLSKDVKLSAGLRRTTETKERTGNAVLRIGALANPFVPPAVVVTNPGDGKTDNAKTTYLLGADWTLSANNFVYAKFSTGFKGGGFNSNGSSAPVPYGPETVNSFEVGSKNRFLNRTVQANVTGFTQTYRGYQASQTTDALSSGGIFNVGNATIRGLELDVVADVAQVARFNFAATALSTKFGNGIVIRDAAGANVDISGKQLPNAPKAVFTAGVERSFDLAGGSLTARVYGKHSSAYYFSVTNYEDEKAPAATTANLLFTYTPADGKWQATAYVENLSDEVVVSNARRNYVARYNIVQFQAPRTYGLRVRYNF